MTQLQLKQAILKTIATNKNDVLELVHSYKKTGVYETDESLLEAVLYLLANNKNFVASFVPYLLKDNKYHNFEGGSSYSGLINDISGAASGLLSGYYSHKSALQGSSFQGQAALLSKESKSKEKITYIIVGGMLLALSVLTVVLTRQK